MKIKAFLLLLLTGASLFSVACSKTETEEMSEPEIATPSKVPVVKPLSVDDQSIVQGQARVLFTDEMVALIENDITDGNGRIVKTRSASLNAVLDELGIVSMHRLFPDAGEYEERTRREGLHKWYVVEFSADQPVTRASEAFSYIEGIETVEPVRKLICTDFNDPQLPQQWHYINRGSIGKAGADINVEYVWNNYTTGSPDVVVAIVDGGIDLLHEDLAWNCAASGHKNFCNGSGAIQAEDHGTHVAGTVAAVNNNGKGVSGIAGGDYAKGIRGITLLSCQIFMTDPITGKESGGGYGGQGIKWGADHGAVIAQNSWGYSFDFNGDGVLEGDELAYALSAKVEGADKQAIDYFIKYAGCDNNGNQKADSPMKGGVVVFSAGNNNITNGCPANYEPVVAVGSFGIDGHKATYSCYGDFVDLAAPGGDYSTGYVVRSTIPNNKYGDMQGTSMACPHVSGVAALVVSYCGGQGFTADMLKSKLLGGADHSYSIIAQSERIGPKVDALGAIMYGSSVKPAKIADYQTSVLSNSVDFTFSHVSDNENKPAYGYMLYGSRNLSSLESMNPANPGSDVVTSVFFPESNAKVGESITGRLKGLDFEADYYVTVAGFTYNRNFGPAAAIKQVKTTENHKPVIDIEGGLTQDVRAFQTARIPVRISDPDEHAFTIEYVPATGGADDLALQPSGEYNIVVSGRDAEPGTYNPVIRVTDEFGLAVEAVLTLIIHPNEPPQKVKDIENIFAPYVGYVVQLNMDDYFLDPDGEDLTYEFVYSDPSVAFFSPNSGILYGTVLKWGTTGITVTAFDSRRLSTTTTFYLAARDPEVVVQSYPNPVTRILSIATGEEELPTHIQVFSSTGSVVYDGTQTTSAFLPATVDMIDCAPGRYSVRVKYGTIETNQIIVKK